MTYLDFVMVGIGGFCGAITRYVIGGRLNQHNNIPLGTLLVNLVGALLIGVVFGLALSRPMTLFFASGLAGALTTFSTLNKELIELWRNGQKNQAVGYLLLTYVGGMVLVAFGYVLAK